MFSVVKAGKGEPARIILICFAMLALGVLNVLYPPVDLLREMLKGTGIFAHPDSACITLNVAGIPCAFCGMSRSLGELLRFNFAGVFYYNPSAIIVYPLLGSVFFGVIMLALKGFKIKIDDSKKFWTYVFGIFLIVWVLNILFGNQ